MRTAKTPTRLRRFLGCSESTLGVYVKSSHVKSYIIYLLIIIIIIINIIIKLFSTLRKISSHNNVSLTAIPS